MKASCGIERLALKMVSNSYTSYFDHCDNGGQRVRCLGSTAHLSDDKITHNVSVRTARQRGGECADICSCERKKPLVKPAAARCELNPWWLEVGTDVL
jgi:hypothetical protein